MGRTFRFIFMMIISLLGLSVIQFLIPLYWHAIAGFLFGGLWWIIDDIAKDLLENKNVSGI